MAKAKLISPVPVTPNVQLELTPEEAQLLIDLLGRVGGNPMESRRKFSISISSALTTVGYVGSYADDINKTSNSVYFLTKDGKSF